MSPIILLAILVAHAIPSFCIITANCSAMVYQAATYPAQQIGYNLCNATTESQSSLCQTAFFNSIDDFCLWGPAARTTDSQLSDNELEQTVAWCTKPGHGTRLMSTDSFHNLTYIQTPDYIQVSGFVDGSVNQSALNFFGDDETVDLSAQSDPRGFDGRGSPIGGLMFSNAFNSNSGSVNQTQYVQATEWDSLIGWNGFYLRVCNPTVPGSGQYCSRWNDDNLLWWAAAFRIVPQNGSYYFNYSSTYESCLGNSTPLGVVVATNGTTITYTGQPLPSYTYPPAATSSCTTYSAADLFDFATVSPGAQVCVTSSTSTAPATTSTAPSKLMHSTKSSKARVGAIVGSVLAALIAISVLVAWILLRKQRQEREVPPEDDHDTKSVNGLATPNATFTSPPLVYTIPSPLPTVHSGVPTDSYTGAPLLTSSDSTYGDGISIAHRVPPSYITRGSVMQSDDELSQWATENRSMIPHSLEKKLRIACYSPSDDPNLLTSAEWDQKYGVGQFELKRLQDLYARRVAINSAGFDEKHSSGQGGFSWHHQQ